MLLFCFPPSFYYGRRPVKRSPATNDLPMHCERRAHVPAARKPLLPLAASLLSCFLVFSSSVHARQLQSNELVPTTPLRLGWSLAALDHSNSTAFVNDGRPCVGTRGHSFWQHSLLFSQHKEGSIGPGRSLAEQQQQQQQQHSDGGSDGRADAAAAGPGAAAAKPGAAAWGDSSSSQVGGEAANDAHSHEHKPLLPLDTRDMVGFVLVAVALFVAAGGGLGGGGILVPVLHVVFDFSTTGAVALSNVTICGGALANLACNVGRRHPLKRDEPLIDWELIIVMEGPTIVGALLGGYVNKVAPGWLTTSLLTAILSYMAHNLSSRALRMYSTESKFRRGGSGGSLRQRSSDGGLGYRRRSSGGGRGSHMACADEDGAVAATTALLVSDGSGPVNPVSAQSIAAYNGMSGGDGGGSAVGSPFLHDPLLLANTCSAESSPTAANAQQQQAGAIAKAVSGGGGNAGGEGSTSGESGSSGDVGGKGGVPACIQARADACASGDGGAVTAALPLIAALKQPPTHVSHGALAEVRASPPGIESPSRSSKSFSRHSLGGLSPSFTAHGFGGEDVPLLHHCSHPPLAAGSGREEGDSDGGGGGRGARARCRALRRLNRQFPLAKVLLLVALFAGVVVTDTFKEELPCGSLQYWAAAMSVIPAILAVAWGVRWHLMRKHARRVASGYQFVPGDVHWTPRNSVLYPAVCSLAGVFAGMFGVGGGIVKGPLMLHMGIPPDVAAATGATMILFTAASAATVYANFGGINPTYGVALASLAFAVTLAGQLATQRLMARLKRRSVIVFAMAALLALSAATVGVQAAYDVVHAVWNHALGEWGHICAPR